MNYTTDPLQRLPNEITSAIFSHLEFHERIRLTAICRSWRQFLLDWPLMWETLDDPECNFGKDLLPYKRFIKHDAIKCLNLENLNFKQHSRALSFMVDVGCTSLKTLKLRFRYIMWGRLEQVLRLSSHSMIELCIQAQQGQPYLLDRILQQCQRIKAIDYHQPGAFDNSSASRSNNKLCFPHVEALHINSARATQQVLHELDLPNLKLLRISNHAGSLRNAQWPQLRVLRLNASKPTFQDIPIEHMPCLESVVIAPILVTDEFLDAIGNLRYLKELGLESPRRGSSDDPPCSEKGIVSMLQGHCRQNLQYLNLSYSGLVSDSVLDAIADIVTQGQLIYLDICISIAKSPAPEQLREAQSLPHRTRPLFSTEIGLRRFACRIADYRLPLLLLRIYDNCSDDTVNFLRDKLGDDNIFSIRNDRVVENIKDELRRIEKLLDASTSQFLLKIYDDIYNELIESCP